MTEPKTNNNNRELLLRQGNVQLLAYWEGEGPHRTLRARITKVIPEEVLKLNPEAGQIWPIEELGTLGNLCEKAQEEAMLRQSIDLGRLTRSLDNAADAATPPGEGAATKKKAAKKTKARSVRGRSKRGMVK